MDIRAQQKWSQSRVPLTREGSIPNPPSCSGQVPMRGTPWGLRATPQSP